MASWDSGDTRPETGPAAGDWNPSYGGVVGLVVSADHAARWRECGGRPRMWSVAAALNVRATAQFQMRTCLGDADDSEEDRSSNMSGPARLPSRSELTGDWRGAEVATGFRLRVNFCPACRMCSLHLHQIRAQIDRKYTTGTIYGLGSTDTMSHLKRASSTFDASTLRKRHTLPSSWSTTSSLRRSRIRSSFRFNNDASVTHSRTLCSE